MLRNERLELRDQVGVAAEREVGVDPFLKRRKTQLLETADRVLRERLVAELRERRPAPQRKRLAKLRGGLRRLSRIALVDEELEPVQVELVTPDTHEVPGRARDDRSARGAERFSKLRDP